MASLKKPKTSTKIINNFDNIFCAHTSRAVHKSFLLKLLEIFVDAFGFIMSANSKKLACQ